MWVASIDELPRVNTSRVRGEALGRDHLISASSPSGAFSFSRAQKRRAGIWLARNLRVEVVARCLYSPSCREGMFSETRPAPVLLAQVLPDRHPCIGPATSGMRMASNGRGSPVQSDIYPLWTRAASDAVGVRSNRNCGSRRWPSWRASVSPRRFDSFPLRSYSPGLSPDKAAPLPLFTEIPSRPILENWVHRKRSSRKPGSRDHKS